MNAIAAYVNQRTYGDVGSLGPYLQQQRESRKRKGYLSRVGGYVKNAYEFVGKPYVGFGLLGGLLGGISGLAFGPLGALFSAAVVGAMGSAFGTSLYWGWTRGERKPGNDKRLDGRSLGKYAADNWKRWFPERQTQSTPQLSFQYA